VWAIVGLRPQTVRTQSRTRARVTEEREGTEDDDVQTVVIGSPVEAEQGTGLAGIGLAGDVLGQSSSWRGGRCSTDRAAASGGVCGGSAGSWRRRWFAVVNVVAR
jgi:hypothetical protein